MPSARSRIAPRRENHRVKQLAIGPTIRFAYQFAFSQLGTIIGLIWAPMVAIAVLRFLPHGLGDTNISPETDPAGASAAGLRTIVFGIVSILLYAVVHAAVIRQALGLRTGPAMFNFTLGRTELRLAGATALLGLVLSALAIGCLLLAAGVTAAVDQAHNAQMTDVVAMLGALVALCVLLVPFVRLTFLYVPVTVMENRISLERGWVLTRGNFWRAGTVMFLASLPVIVILFGAYWLLMARDFATLMPMAGKLDTPAFFIRLQAITDRHIATLIGINLIVTPFYLGLTLGAAAAAYRALSDGVPVPKAEG
jgi:hypothetical protein